MAQDDYFVIVYKILKYLYQCMRAGKRPMADDICHESQLFSIPETYWTQIMEELIDQGYVKGIVKVPMTGRGTGIKINPEAAITMRGVEFLQDNSMMRKAKDAAGKGFETVLSSIVGQLPQAMVAAQTMMGNM